MVGVALSTFVLATETILVLSQPHGHHLGGACVTVGHHLPLQHIPWGDQAADRHLVHLDHAVDGHGAQHA